MVENDPVERSGEWGPWSREFEMPREEKEFLEAMDREVEIQKTNRIVSKNNMIATEFVSKYYEMNPETDELVPNGHGLKEGMIVLFDNSDLREDSRHTPSALLETVLYSSREKNRWCSVTNLEYEGEQMSFIGVYEDGISRRREFDVKEAWLVKKDSIPSNPLFELVLDLVTDATKERWFNRDVIDPKEHNLEVTRKIIALFD